jgi:hypothetical protein
MLCFRFPTNMTSGFRYTREKMLSMQATTDVKCFTKYMIFIYIRSDCPIVDDISLLLKR